MTSDTATKTPIFIKDMRALAPCTEKVEGRYPIGKIEVNPIGMVATNGRVLAVRYCPGRKSVGYLDPKSIKGTPSKTIEDTDLNNLEKNFFFPKWGKVLPKTDNLQTGITFNLHSLKIAIAALERNAKDNNASITLYLPKDGKGATLAANAHGDLAVLMPVLKSANIPEAVYSYAQVKFENH